MGKVGEVMSFWQVTSSLVIYVVVFIFGYALGGGSLIKLLVYSCTAANDMEALKRILKRIGLDL